MKPTVVTIAHLYPGEMNIYGDRGNVMTLQRRLEWRGYSAQVVLLEVGQPFDLTKADLIFGGGGQDSGQALIGFDLLQRGAEIRALAEAGVPMLVVCGLYQLFGRGFAPSIGPEIEGINVFDAHTVATQARMTGNIVVKSPWGRLVGFENHSGVTTLSKGQEAIGRALKGSGNGSTGRLEGALRHNVVGTYLHGPVLPKNPVLADWLISKALERRGIRELAPLDDSLELKAAEVAALRSR